MFSERGFRSLFVVLSVFLGAHGLRAAASPDAMTRLGIREVRVEGAIGRRVDITLRNNLLVLDVEKNFLAPFRKKNLPGGYIGLGKLIQTAVRYAALTGQKKVLEFKRNLVSRAIACQDADGYLGALKPEARVWGLWDISEMGYLIIGLVSDWNLFREKKSLEAARRLGDYLISRWSAEPGKIPGGGHLTVHMAVVGVDTALLALSEATGDPKYRRFCIEFRKILEWNPPIVRGRWGRIEGLITRETDGKRWARRLDRT